MKSASFFFIAIVAFLMFSFAHKDDKLSLKTDSSTIKWEAKEAVGGHNGAIKFKSGTLLTKNNQPTGGEFIVDMASVTCADLTDKEYNAKLIGHLKDEDFFNTAKHPTAKFVISKVEFKGGNDYKISGDMTIKGISKPLSFDGIIQVDGKTTKASAKVTIDRTQYDIKYKSKSFFPEVGDKFIYDEFTLDLEMTFQK